MKRAVGVVVGLLALAGIVWWNRVGPKEKYGLESVTVPEGFAVEMASKPGLVKFPMLGTIAPDGTIYMCESSGRTYGKTPEMTPYVVIKIEDIDSDGIYDKSTVFADKLTLPAGAVWYKDSLYVAAPPYLYRLRDTNGDGVADEKEVVVQGWNLSANAASLHGPIMGPDGWLYLTDGRHGFKIDTKDGKHHEGKASRICAWFVHGCPLSRVAKPDMQGMLYRVKKKGANAEKPDLKKIFAGADGKKLAALLDDPRPVESNCYRLLGRPVVGRFPGGEFLAVAPIPFSVTYTPNQSL